jgi:hypothetical protein
MGKFRFRSHLDKVVFVLLVMAGAVVAAVLDVRAIEAAMASGQFGLGAGIAAAAPLPAPPAAAASAADWQETAVARVSRLLRRGRAAT